MLPFVPSSAELLKYLALDAEQLGIASNFVGDHKAANEWFGISDSLIAPSYAIPNN